jgi:hypothetical protein
VARPNTRVTYIDKGAVAAAMAEQHAKPRPNWGNVLGWIALCSLVVAVALWWWALFC